MTATATAIYYKKEQFNRYKLNLVTLEGAVSVAFQSCISLIFVAVETLNLYAPLAIDVAVVFSLIYEQTLNTLVFICVAVAVKVIICNWLS